ncbi:MAG: O-methyltransferase [Planctomycetota bacterium]
MPKLLSLLLSVLTLPSPLLQAGQPDLARPPVPKDKAEKKILAVLDDMHRTQRAGHWNVSLADGRLLRLLTEATGAKHVVEIGTSNGYSGLWFLLALRQTGGTLTTHEIDKGRAALARKNFDRAGVGHLATIVLGDAHQTTRRLKAPIDILFLDADPGGYGDYMARLLPLVRPGGLILTHNTRWPRPDPDHIKAITTDPRLETVFLHMHDMGLGVTLKKR